jgi:hypothetical protein
VSALRVNHPAAPVLYVDLGPCPWVPLHGHATLRGHAVVSGRLARPEPESEPAPSMSLGAQRMRALRERQRVAS